MPPPSSLREGPPAPSASPRFLRGGSRDPPGSKVKREHPQQKGPLWRSVPDGRVGQRGPRSKGRPVQRPPGTLGQKVLEGTDSGVWEPPGARAQHDLDKRKDSTEPCPKAALRGRAGQRSLVLLHVWWPGLQGKGAEGASCPECDTVTVVSVLTALFLSVKFCSESGWPARRCVRPSPDFLLKTL
ncbi:collectin-43-like [Prionailurus viverrinus]|uniref:collectin-43-like n=1 Tax=Prionailurus viverrinus TaxID=61388 RepID=UPI001FF13C52|nr:collectin-43-like [Prionailurus viverrinus]